MKIAVIVPVKNEEQGLVELVQKLLQQASDNDEIIFVDAGSTDRTQEILNQASKEHRQVKMIVSPGAYPGKGRNIGIANTDAEIIVQIDGGNLPGPCWLNKMIAPIIAERADFVWGDYRFMPVIKKISNIELDLGEVYGCSLLRRYGRSSLQDVSGGACVAYKRWVWETVGGFPEWTQVAEDKLFVKKIKDRNIRMLFVEDALIYWQIGPRLTDIIKRQINNQKVKFIIRGELIKSRGLTQLPLVFLAMILCTLSFPEISPFTLVVFLAHWLRQSFKAFRCYKNMGRNGRVAWLAGVPAIMFIEFISIFSKIVGSIIGIMNLEQGRKFSKQSHDYLYNKPAEGPHAAARGK